MYIIDFLKVNNLEQVAFKKKNKKFRTSILTPLNI